MARPAQTLSFGSSASGSDRAPLTVSLNSRSPCPSDRPAAGRRFGPSTRRATTSTMTISVGPMLGIGLFLPFWRLSVRHGSGDPAVHRASQDDRSQQARLEQWRVGAEVPPSCEGHPRTARLRPALDEPVRDLQDPPGPRARLVVLVLRWEVLVADQPVRPPVGDPDLEPVGALLQSLRDVEAE